MNKYCAVAHLALAVVVEGCDGSAKQAENHFDKAAGHVERKDALIGDDGNRKEQGHDGGNHLLFHGAQ